MASNLPDPTRALATFTYAGPARDGEIPVLAPRVRVGQGAQNDVVLDDDTVSTSHASLEFAGGAWQLTDLASKNGTFVNGERIAPNVPIALADGDSVGFGALRVVFNSRDPAIAETATSAYAPPAPTPGSPKRSGFRLPVWVVLLVLLLLAVLLAVLFLSGGEPVPVEPVVPPVVDLSLLIEALLAA